MAHGEFRIGRTSRRADGRGVATPRPGVEVGPANALRRSQKDRGLRHVCEEMFASIDGLDLGVPRSTRLPKGARVIRCTYYCTAGIVFVVAL